ncbi:MAG: hypothetical protein AAF702_12105 [Chloroflexota bacterium]
MEQFGIRRGKWQVASGKWQVASGKWQVASGKWQVARTDSNHPPLVTQNAVIGS